jgi:hypothetical protein
LSAALMGCMTRTRTAVTSSPTATSLRIIDQSVTELTTAQQTQSVTATSVN